MNERNTSFNGDFSGLDLHNEDTFLSLYDFFAPRLLKHATVRLHSVDEAKDVVSQVFLKAWEYIADDTETKKPIRNVKAFLYQVTNNQIIDVYRKKSRTDVSLEALPFIEELADIAQEMQARSHDVFDAKVIHASMGVLRRDYQELLFWRYLDDLSISEIAGITGKSRGAVSVMLYRALSALKRAVKEKGF